MLKGAVGRWHTLHSLVLEVVLISFINSLGNIVKIFIEKIDVQAKVDSWQSRHMLIQKVLNIIYQEVILSYVSYLGSQIRFNFMKVKRKALSSLI